jgi:hypothetical protein
MSKIITIEYLEEFEQGLDPQFPERSGIPALVIGFGEISSIFKIEGVPNWIFKRLPLFDTIDQTESYINNYTQYTDYLKIIGIGLPGDFSKVVKGKRVVLYLAQEEIKKEDLCQNKLQIQSEDENLLMLRDIFKEIKKVYLFNQENKDKVELSIDGQVSNWAMVNNKLLFFDTSTPLLKLFGKEQLNPGLLLNSTPRALRWMIRSFFLREVMDRYYDIHEIYLDLLANLYKEQKEVLIPDAMNIANNLLTDGIKKISRKEIDRYYQNDKFIWQLFLGLRRLDRWLTINIFRKQYEFILPGKIKR